MGLRGQFHRPFNELFTVHSKRLPHIFRFRPCGYRGFRLLAMYGKHSSLPLQRPAT